MASNTARRLDHVEAAARAKVIEGVQPLVTAIAAWFDASLTPEQAVAYFEDTERPLPTIPPDIVAIDAQLDARLMPLGALSIAELEATHGRIVDSIVKRLPYEEIDTLIALLDARIKAECTK